VVQTAKALGAVVNRGIVWVVSFFWSPFEINIEAMRKQLNDGTESVQAGPKSFLAAPFCDEESGQLSFPDARCGGSAWRCDRCDPLR
jgi:hypothetical protein